MAWHGDRLLKDVYWKDGQVPHPFALAKHLPRSAEQKGLQEVVRETDQTSPRGRKTQASPASLRARGA
jgi:hypothetical protein